MKKILSVLITAVLCMSLTPFGYAEEDVDKDSIAPASVDAATRNQDVVSSEPEEILYPPVEVKIDELEQYYDMTPDSNLIDIDNALTKGKELVKKERSATQSWTGTLANEGDISYVFATLAPSQIVNASLVCPRNANLNYDLFIYRMDAAGTLVEMVAASTTETYINGRVGKTVDEGASYINTSTETRDYAIIVSATKGGSSTDTFTLTVSVDVAGNYDAAEPNDSPYYAYSVALGSIINGPTLHVANDQDWYVMNVNPEDSAVRLAANTASGSYSTELYTVEGNKMVRCTLRSDDAYSLRAGVYFIRVYANQSGFTPQSYVLNIGKLAYSGESQADFSESIQGYSMRSVATMSVPQTYTVDVYLTSGTNRTVFLFQGSPDSYEEIIQYTGGTLQYTTPGLMLSASNTIRVSIYNDTPSQATFEAKLYTKYHPL